ncbi:MAG TPA: M28 family peptidase [Tepidiformaceae bacterium]|nr:M28 family peptidase [Tepidiformaceae bacterium]
MALEKILKELSPERAYRHIEHITTNIPSRLAGSPNSHRMADYASETFQKAGLDTRIHKFLGLVSFPEAGRVRVLEPEQREIEAHTLGHSAVTEGVEGELVYVASGAESEYAGKDVTGKVTLSELSYSPARHEKAYIAWKRGSIAQIMMNWGDANNQAVPFGSMKSAWGNPTPDTLEREMPDIPCVGIARTEGLRLKGLCAAGPVRVRVRAQAENGWKPLSMTSAEFGAEAERQFLLLGGHMDSWFGPQATDNAAGDACMMELSRVFRAHGDELRRGLVTCLWMGHETGTMISSSRFADVNWDRLRRRCVAYVQIDQPAMTGTSTWHQHSTDDIQNYAVNTTREVIGNMPIHWRRQQKNGDSSFFGVGLACAAGEMSFTDEEIQRTALANLGWWHHSIHNTIDKIDRDLLALHLRVYAHWLWGLLTEPVLPYEYTPIATRFADRLEELAKLNIPDIDMAAAAQQAREFRELAQSFDAQTQTWRQRIRSGVAGGPVPDLLNGTMLRLSRILVPIASTVVGAYGQDRYGHAWQTQMIPSLVPYPQVDKYDRESEEFQTWWVAMIRARNRVVDALADAGAAVRLTLDALGR